jgi:large subunit ribosomal protein L13e
MHYIKPQILKQDGKQRVGRGFSREELKNAGLNLQEARRIQLPIDFRRHTAHDENVKAIKTYASHERTKQRRAPKKVEARTEKPKS